MPPRIPDIAKVRQLIPPLTHEFHKGQAGKVFLAFCKKKCIIVTHFEIHKYQKKKKKKDELVLLVVQKSKQ
jgi:hypothetical protein